MTDNKSQLSQWNELDKARTLHIRIMSDPDATEEEQHESACLAVSAQQDLRDQFPAMLAALNAMDKENEQDKAEIERWSSAYETCHNERVTMLAAKDKLLAMARDGLQAIVEFKPMASDPQEPYAQIAIYCRRKALETLADFSPNSIESEG